VLDCCVANIRRKLSLHKDSEFMLHSVYGRGYELRHVPGSPIAGTVDDSGFPDTSNEPIWLGEISQASQARA
jgi:hypothetical protein